MLRKVRLGDLLVEKKVITEKQLEDALTEQKSSRQRLGRLLVSLGYVDEKQLLMLLAEQLQIEFIDLVRFKVNTESVLQLSEMNARRLRALVIDEKEGHFIVAMADPTDLDKFDQLQEKLSKPVKLCVALESEIITNIDNLYRSASEISSLAEELEDELSDDSFDLPGLNENLSNEDAPVAKLLQSIFDQAMQMKASDVHIEPDSKVLRVRMRVDGQLQEQVIKETRIVPALVLRLKLMCGLDISEKRIPQDGRFRIRARGHEVDIRLSTMPVQHGESVVMRLLDQSSGLLKLEQTGIEPKILKEIRKLLAYPHGLILVTGPTGSGKTTTLYSALSELNSPEKKIITIEDPVEYKLSRINQVQVNNKIDLTFAKVLRAVLRQDPDIVLVGEMRDQETAEIGLRAAVTGHLVLSTLHTNDTLSAAIRLADMGAEPYLLASGLRGVIAQRLVRRICSFCIEDYHPDEHEVVWLAKESNLVDETTKWKHGKGCVQCHNTGYLGRAAIFEILLPDKKMLEAIRTQNFNQLVQLANQSEFYTPLSQSAINLAMDGITSVEEVLRVCESIEDLEK
ncbi:GspE/PulE family protein [Aliikangiella coralliicola]|uniref:Type II/IV secretion system protein n=1 Tax=Aliikangiella coralliicola TaxID=2592383 RepID=A0A545UGE0_9GAMM|nr:GspE/PulE family protein [Aliikangiella coralliicola]TQV88538.1 type II/IV secretion system protein [Aliikangiella coralliicola]